jgi:N-methylhydantoinase A
VVVCFLHSYAFPRHETRAVELLRQALPDDVYVIASTEVYPEFREYERFTTAVLNGALLTVIDRYLSDLTAETRRLGVRAAPRISQSSGGLMSVDMARRMPIRASLSGPAAGVAAVVHSAGRLGREDIITLDVGGTSADVALIRHGRPSEIAVQEIGGFPIRLPAIDVTAVGAGGGTIAWIDTDGLMKVGPQSAGADPGPACYGLGGRDATVTDANVCLGRLNREALLDGRMPIDAALAEEAIAGLAAKLKLSLHETAHGILRIASATVVRAIRKVSVERGHDPADFVLFAYGGAGPLFAIDVAREIGIGTVVIPPRPGLMCAEGLRHGSLMNDFVRTALVLLDDDVGDAIFDRCRSLRDEADAWFAGEGVAPAERRYAWQAEMRYRGQNFELSLPLDESEARSLCAAELGTAFHEAHVRAYGFAAPEEPVELVNVRLKAMQPGPGLRVAPLEECPPATPGGSRAIVFDGDEPIDTPVFRRARLAPGQALRGPCVLEQQDTTSLVYPGDSARVDKWGNLTVQVGGGAPS